MLESFGLDGRVALVTGAARGLGLEIARALARAGATVYINGTNEDRLLTAVQRLQTEGLSVKPALFDVSKEDLAEAALARIFSDEGRFDILFNNVGARLREPLDRIDRADMARLFDVNVLPAFSMSKQAAAMMAKGGYGRIINISSTASERGRSGDLAYITVKGATNAMTRAMAAEFAPTGITCNAILPGPFLTETNEEAFSAPGMKEWFHTRVLLQRPGKPLEISGAAVFLASPAASFVTGISLPVDGGYLAAG